MKTVFFFCLLLTFSAYGKTAPMFRGETITGNQVSLADSLKKDRVLLVTFWSSWCTSCMEELRQVREHLSKNKNFPLDVITVNVDTSETASSVAPAIRLYGISFPVILDPKHEIFSKFQPDKSLPYSVLVASNGTVEKVFNGYQETMFTEIQEVLNKRTN